MTLVSCSAAQQAHAADRLPHSAALRGRKQPRRVLRGLALVSRLSVK